MAFLIMDLYVVDFYAGFVFRCLLKCCIQRYVGDV